MVDTSLQVEQVDNRWFEIRMNYLLDKLHSAELLLLEISPSISNLEGEGHSYHPAEKGTYFNKFTSLGMIMSQGSLTDDNGFVGRMKDEHRKREHGNMSTEN